MYDGAMIQSPYEYMYCVRSVQAACRGNWHANIAYELSYNPALSSMHINPIFH